jgi:molybdopterin synthase sulfur carrier subunit
MIHHVSYYGLLADRRGLAEERIESTASNPREIYQKIDAAHQLGLAISDVRAAVNDEFVSWDHPLNDGDRIAFLPPMSGG